MQQLSAMWDTRFDPGTEVRALGGNGESDSLCIYQYRFSGFDICVII